MERCGDNEPTQRRHGTTRHQVWVGVSRTAGRAVTCLVVLLALFASPLLQRATGQAYAKVGVAEFYAPTPLGDFFGFNPLRFAAADLTDSLSRAGGKFAVIPRATMEQAEIAMQWQGVDALHYDRLAALAHAVGADWIVTGWIQELVVNSAGRPGNDMIIIGGGGQKVAYAAVVVQTFSAPEGRIVGQTTKYGSTTTAEVRSDIAMRVLRDTLQPTVPWLLNAFTEQAR